MPLYVYSCPRCEHELERSRPVAERDQPVWCEGEGSFIPLGGDEPEHAELAFTHPPERMERVLAPGHSFTMR